MANYEYSPARKFVKFYQIMVSWKYEDVEAILLCNARIQKKTITVPVPNHNELRIGTLQSIIRQSNIPRSKFEA